MTTMGRHRGRGDPHVTRWYGLVGTEVIGPFEVLDVWYHHHAGPDWRMAEYARSGTDPWRVARTELGDGRAVSTVFLGLDYSWRPGERAPLLFETNTVPDYEEPWRTSTWLEAMAMHHHVVTELGGLMRWYHEDGTLCVAGWDPSTGLCAEGGGPVRPGSDASRAQ